MKTYKIIIPASMNQSSSFEEGFKQACVDAGADFESTKEASQDFEKQAVPLIPLLSAAAMLPLGYEAASRTVKGLGSGIAGEHDDAGRNLLLAGLAGLSSLPFIGSAAKGVGHVGRALRHHAKTGKIPTTTGGLGLKAQEPGKFVRAVRAPHMKGLDFLARRLGKERADSLGRKLMGYGRIGNVQPFRLFDRGIRQGGMLGVMVPSVAASLGIEHMAAPLRGKIYQDMHRAAMMKNQPVEPYVPQQSTVSRFLDSMRADNSLAEDLLNRNPYE